MSYFAVTDFCVTSLLGFKVRVDGFNCNLAEVNNVHVTDSMFPEIQLWYCTCQSLDHQNVPPANLM